MAPDPRFSLANERTYLAWVRTSLALVVAGLAAAKALPFEHDLLRWLVAVPPVLGGAVLTAQARTRWRGYEDALEQDRPLPVGAGLPGLTTAIVAYAILALAATALDELV